MIIDHKIRSFLAIIGISFCPACYSQNYEVLRSGISAETDMLVWHSKSAQMERDTTDHLKKVMQFMQEDPPRWFLLPSGKNKELEALLIHHDKIGNDINELMQEKKQVEMGLELASYMALQQDDWRLMKKLCAGSRTYGSDGDPY